MSNIKSKINKEVKMIAEVVVKKYKPDKIILYGSVARGEVRENSDIDLCIIKKTTLPFRKRLWKVYELIRGVDYNYGIEPVVFTPKEFQERQDNNNFFVRNILKDGKVLYEATGQ